MELQTVVSAIAAWMFVPILIAAMVAVVRWKQLSIAQRRVGVLTFVALVTQVSSYFLWVNEVNNLPLLHIYTLIEFVLILWFFTGYYRDAVFRKRMILLGWLFSAYVVINATVIQSIFEINAPVRAVESLIVIGVSLYFWMKTLKELMIERLVETAFFWFNTAFLIYFSVNFLLFVFSSDLHKLPVEKVVQPWFFHFIFMVIYYLLIAIGLWKKRLR